MSRPIPPAIFVQTVAANTRQSFVSQVFWRPFTLDAIRVVFAVNTQRLLRVSVWVTGNSAAPANNSRPSGMNLMADIGTQDYVVGDGLDGEYIIPIGREFAAGQVICVEANNTDPTNTHTLNCRADLTGAG